MALKPLFRANVPLCLQVKHVSTKSWFSRKSVEKKPDPVDTTTVDETPVYFLEEEQEAIIEDKRNKSRLNTAHRNILMGQKPYESSIEWYHDTIKYKRNTLGRYGINALDVPAGVAWPTFEEVEDRKEYERVGFPLSIEERWKKLAEARMSEEEAIKKREADIIMKMSQLETWVKELQQRIAKKKAEETKAKARRERLIQQVRANFGYDISVRDKRFHDMYEQLEKADKKKMKEEKTRMKLQKQQQRIMEMEINSKSKDGQENVKASNEVKPTATKE